MSDNLEDCRKCKHHQLAKYATGRCMWLRSSMPSPVLRHLHFAYNGAPLDNYFNECRFFEKLNVQEKQ